MFRRILVPTDFSAASAAALLRAEELARLAHAELLLLHVRDEFPFVANDGSGFVPAELRSQHTAAQEQVEQLATDLVSRGVQARGLLVLGAAPQRITAVAQHERADLVIVGTNGRTGIRHLILGSVAERVARTSPVPVMVVSSADAPDGSRHARTFLSPDPRTISLSILVAVDFESASLAAVPFAFELAHIMRGRVHLLHACNSVAVPFAQGWGDASSAPLQQRALVRLRELAGPYFSSPYLGEYIARMGEPSLVVRETASALSADVIVVGTHARTGPGHLFLGSVAERVIREAGCPVVVAREHMAALRGAQPHEREPSPGALFESERPARAGALS